MDVDFLNDYAFIQAHLRRRGIAAVDLDDVTQDVILAMLGAKFRVYEDRPPDKARRATIFGILRHVLAARRRAAARRDLHLPTVLSEDPEKEQDAGTLAPTLEDEALTAEAEHHMREALAELASIHRDQAEVLWRYDVDDQEMRDIADELGVRLNTAWNRLRLAREALRRILAKLTRDRGR